MSMMTTPVATTDSVITENIYAIKREPLEAAKMIDKLDLKIVTRGSNRHEVAGETFHTREQAGEYVRKLRRLAETLKHESSTQQP